VPRPIFAPLASLAVGLALGACGGGDQEAARQGQTSSAPAGAPTAPAAALPAGCRKVAQPRPRPETKVPRPRGRLSRGAWTVQMRTSCGTFAIRLAVERAPRTAASFAGLVRRRFYDGLTFHRIAGDPASGPFVIQGGDPLGSGLGGPGFSVVERPPRGVRYTRYTVAMAKTQTEPAGASGSQFFVVTAPDAGLPPDYALVGRVTTGREVVNRIASVPTGENERPVSPIVIERAKLRRA
jgi:peptidyl-prolyl cis-trans isomerase B (cyclophilin B)